VETRQWFVLDWSQQVKSEPPMKSPGAAAM
jgi:hypothetical protein